VKSVPWQRVLGVAAVRPRVGLGAVVEPVVKRLLPIRQLGAGLSWDSVQPPCRRPGCDLIEEVDLPAFGEFAATEE